MTQQEILIYRWLKIFQRYIKMGKMKPYQSEKAEAIQAAYIKKNALELIVRKKHHLLLLAQKAETIEERNRYKKLYHSECCKWYYLKNQKKLQERRKERYACLKQE